MDAVVCYNDQNMRAFSVIRRVRSTRGYFRNWFYDNSFLANRRGTRLTTIDHPQEKLGAMAAGTVLLP